MNTKLYHVYFLDGYTTDDIRFNFPKGNKELAVTGMKNVKLAQFQLVDWRILLINVSFATGDNAAYSD